MQYRQNYNLKLQLTCRNQGTSLDITLPTLHQSPELPPDGLGMLTVSMEKDCNKACPGNAKYLSIPLCVTVDQHLQSD